MRIFDIFRNPIDRRIEEVIKVDFADEEAVAREIDEYVVTDHIRKAFEEVLDRFQETINKPDEGTNVWISGFFGSGKSSFAKIAGYLLEDAIVSGKSATDRFLARTEGRRLEALLTTIHSHAPSISIFVDLSSGKNVAKEGESVVLPLYRALLDRLDYSRDFALAQLEFELEGDGDLKAFEENFSEVTNGRATWRSRRNISLARNEASHALHLLRPKTYSSPDSWSRSVAAPVIDANFFADRTVQIFKRRAQNCRRVVFVVDEVGQYVSRDVQRLLDLQGVAHAIQKKRGQLWFVVTSQETLEDVVDSIEGRRVELARAQARFPIRVDLIPSDIEDVTAKRVLQKTATGQDNVRKCYREHRNKLAANVRLDSPTRGGDLSEEEFVRLYPLVPYQIQLLIDAVSAHRAGSGAQRMLGGSNRTIIKLAQQLIVNQKTNLGDKEVGALATADLAYDLLDSIIPTSWQGEIEQVATRHGHSSAPVRVAKAIALTSGVRALHLNANNIAAMLHPSIDSEPRRDEVSGALKTLVSEEVLRQTDEGYKLQSPEEKHWEKQRAGIEMRPVQFGRIKREMINQLLSGLTVQAGRSFKVAVTVDSESVLEGEVPLEIIEAETGLRESVRARSREKACESTIIWTFQGSGESYEIARNLHQSQEMVKRKEPAAKSGPEIELLGEERKRLTKFEASLRDSLGKDLLGGTLFFRGVQFDPQGKDFRTAAEQVVDEKIPDIYPRLGEFSAPVKRNDPLLVLRADSLTTLADYFREEGLGIVRIKPEGLALVLDQGAAGAVLTEIRSRANYGMEASGKYLESLFSGPPFGAQVEVVQALIAAGFRAGLIEAIHQGARISNPKDPRLEKVFSTLPAFRAATFVPQRELDVEIRGRVAKRLGELTGTRPNLAVESLAAQLRDTFKDDAEVFSGVIASVNALRIRVPHAVEHASEIVRQTRTASNEEIIKSCDEMWNDLVEGRKLAYRLSQALDEQGLDLLRRSRREVESSSTGLDDQVRQDIAALRDLLDAGDIVDQMGQIRALVEKVFRARTSAWNEVAEKLREKVAIDAERIRAGELGQLDQGVFGEAVRPLLELAPPPTATLESGPALEVLHARLDAVPTIAEKIRIQLEQLLHRTEVVRVHVRDLYDRVVTNEEELQALIDRIRKAAEEALAARKHFHLS